MSVEGEERREQYQRPKRIDAPKEGNAPKEQIDLDTARAILQAIVNTPESTITDISQVDRIAGYSIEQVREAERMVVQDLMDRHGAKKSEGKNIFTSWIRRSIEKPASQGYTLILELGSVGDRETLELELQKADRKHSAILNTYALNEPDDLQAIGYKVWRPGETFAGLDANLGRLQGAKTNEERLQIIRFMWRGQRWMNANMLAWDNPNTIIPKDLDTAPGSSPQETPKSP